MLRYISEIKERATAETKRAISDLQQEIETMSFKISNTESAHTADLRKHITFFSDSQKRFKLRVKELEGKVEASIRNLSTLSHRRYILRESKLLEIQSIEQSIKESKTFVESVTQRREFMLDKIKGELLELIKP